MINFHVGAKLFCVLSMNGYDSRHCTQGMNTPIEQPVENSSVVRFSATVEPEVLENAKALAKSVGFRFSFSAYVNDLLRRDFEQRSRLCTAQQ